MTDAKYDIFIAYKHEDRPTANQLLSNFQEQGLRVFIDTSINAGSQFSVELEQALDASRTVVVLWSEQSKTSRFVLDEANEGVERGVLFPVLIEDTKIPYGFRQFQTVNLCKWDGEPSHPEYNKLFSAITIKLGTDKPEALKPSKQKPPNKQPGETYRDTLNDGSHGPAMVVIPSGRFLMGSPDGEGMSDEHPEHEVTIKEPFSMGKYAVSFAEYDQFCQSTQRELVSDKFGRDKQPVINVTWHDAIAYCQWLSDMTGKDYDLPSEARWEYACRAGTTTPWNTGKTLSHDQANYDNINEGTVAVDQYQPNHFGLFQMHGNVREWCLDEWQDDYEGAPTDGSARGSNSTSASRALRGGSWISTDDLCRSSSRRNLLSDNHYNRFGFRLSCLSPFN
ncbi:MAG: SUMF1/EgtB/PvdO family nonheme iron enzyme [Granulosicoccus sp.]